MPRSIQTLETMCFGVTIISQFHYTRGDLYIISDAEIDYKHDLLQPLNIIKPAERDRRLSKGQPKVAVVVAVVVIKQRLGSTATVAVVAVVALVQQFRQTSSFIKQINYKL